MLDEHFMRDWNEVHGHFTADLHATLTGLGRYRLDRSLAPDTIETAYQPAPSRTLKRMRTIVSSAVALAIAVSLFAGALAVLTAPRTALAANSGLILV